MYQKMLRREGRSGKKSRREACRKVDGKFFVLSHIHEKDATENKMFPNCVIKQQYSQETFIHSGSLKFLEFFVTYISFVEVSNEN